jgi:hypothetical protein
MRVEKRGTGVLDLVSGPPACVTELAAIGTQGWFMSQDKTNHKLTSVCRLGPRGGLGDGHEHGVLTGDWREQCLDAQLLPGFPAHGSGGALRRLDVPASRQPQPGSAMVDQQHISAVMIDQQEVRHQMRRGVRGLIRRTMSLVLSSQVSA